MTAAIEGRNTKRREATRVGHPVGALTIYAGTLVALLLTDGTAVPAGTPGSGPVVGVAQTTLTGGSDELVETWRDLAFLFDNSDGDDAIARAAIGSTAYVADDQTVALTDDSGARQTAGKIIDVDAGGVWVLVG